MKINIQDNKEKLLRYGSQFRDVRAAGLVMFLVIVLLVSWSGAKVIETNYHLQRQISTQEQHVQVQDLTNTNLDLQNKYFQTDTYLEITARQNFGLAAPGESVINVSKQAALARTVELPNTEEVQAKKVEDKRPTYQRNFQSWMKFFLHRQAE